MNFFFSNLNIFLCKTNANEVIKCHVIVIT